jgi:hypothetical protein
MYVVVYKPPANFSFSLLRPGMTGTASSSSLSQYYLHKLYGTNQESLTLPYPTPPWWQSMYALLAKGIHEF